MGRRRFLAVLAVAFVIGLPSSWTRAEQRETVLLGKGRPWETPCYVRDTGVEGPTVLVVGGMHGNEPAGARAAEQIRHWPLVRGRLIVVPRANTRALQANSRYTPGVPVDVRNLNRNFPGDEPGKGDARGEIAAALWMLVLERKPDWIFDLHEGYEFNVSHRPAAGTKKSVGSSLIFRSVGEEERLAKRMHAAVNATVTDPDRRFSLLGGGPVRTGIVSATTRRLGIRGMIVETTYARQRLSVRTHQHRVMMNVALRELGLVDRDCVDVLVPARKPGRIAVGLFDGDGASEGGIGNVVRVLDRAGDVSVAHLRPADLRKEVLARFDAVVFSGGSGSKQAKAIGKTGSEAVRTFVRDGGGYVGICAGAYLCSAHYDWSLKLIDTHVLTGAVEVEGLGRKQMWYRGGAGNVEMQLTAAGRRVFGRVPESVTVRYQNGPIVSPKKRPGLTPYVPLAYFRTEKTRYPPQEGTMIDTPAVVMGPFGEGRVISISPHPEATEGLESMIDSAVRTVRKSIEH